MAGYSTRTGRAIVSKSGQARVAKKIHKLVSSGEVPNTKLGRAKAAGMSYGMEKTGRLGPKGGYKRAKK